jgi:hypothetical protein
MKSDRDQSIERLLRGLPRSDGGTSRDDSCPDAETLAAFADHTLAAAVRREIETHVADCDRCQMVTATLARAEGMHEAATADVRTWRRRAVNWLVPAAAAATAVALWVIVPGQRMPAPEEAVLDRQTAVTPSAPAAETPTGQRLQTPVDALRDQSAAASAEARAERAIPAEVAQPSPALKAEQPRAKAAAGGLPPSREASADRSSLGGGGQVSGQSARSDATRRENDTSVEERAVVEAPGRSAAPVSAAGFQARVASSEIVSSNAQVRWRIGPGTVVQHSADGGRTWVPQQAGATADLAAGSSPSADVCWLVGRGGLVLRTIDGGGQWQRVPFPEAVDIIAVTAANAVNAAISSADGRRFQTADGGRTWVRLP